MKRLQKLAVLAVSTALLTASMATAQAQQGPPDHGHLLLTGLEFDGDEPIGYKKCRLLANGREVPLHAHHDNLHDEEGRGSQGLKRAGNAVVPLAPLTPWSTCEEFDAFIFG